MNDISQPSTATETLACYGSPVKALGEGRVGGYLVLFSGPGDPDLQGDYFTKETDFLIDSGDSRPILYRHGVHPVIKSKKLGRASLTIDDVGIFVEGELDLRDKYVRAIYALAEKNQLGWSSGSMSHLVQRTPNGKAFEIKSWALGECSLTPAPVEGRTSAFPLKEMARDTLLPEDVTELDFAARSLERDPVDPGAVPSIKEFCEAVSPSSLKDGSQRSQSAQNAVQDYISLTNILGEAFHSYASRLVRRTENRFIKANDTLDSGTIMQANQLLGEMDRLLPAFSSIKEALLGIQRIGELSKAEQKALSERARLSLMSYCHISGTTLEEMEDNGRRTG